MIIWKICINSRSTKARISLSASEEVNFVWLYETATLSYTYGMSGGPVVAVDEPIKLAGLSVGEFSEQNQSLLVLVQQPAIQAAYERYVINSNE